MRSLSLSPVSRRHTKVYPASALHHHPLLLKRKKHRTCICISRIQYFTKFSLIGVHTLASISSMMDAIQSCCTPNFKYLTAWFCPFCFAGQFLFSLLFITYHICHFPLRDQRPAHAQMHAYVITVAFSLPPFMPQSYYDFSSHADIDIACASSPPRLFSQTVLSSSVLSCFVLFCCLVMSYNVITHILYSLIPYSFLSAS